MTPFPYRRWRRVTLLIILVLDLSIFVWHLRSRSTLLDASGATCLALVIGLSCCDGRGMFTLHGRM